ncbi:MAG: DUF6527 family protein [Balneola sp.]
MKIIDHKFVEFIPDQKEMQDGVIYISLEYDTAVHNCACGCGEQVVTPFSPTDWKLTYNGESVSLYPSIGNWEFNCRSHYWIKKGKILWAEDWSDKQIEANRYLDKKTKEKSFKLIDEDKVREKKSPFDWFKNIFNRN